jgi:hypothetical protein
VQGPTETGGGAGTLAAGASVGGNGTGCALPAVRTRPGPFLTANAPGFGVLRVVPVARRGATAAGDLDTAATGARSAAGSATAGTAACVSGGCAAGAGSAAGVAGWVDADAAGSAGAWAVTAADVAGAPMAAPADAAVGGDTSAGAFAVDASVGAFVGDVSVGACVAFDADCCAPGATDCTGGDTAIGANTAGAEFLGVHCW